MRAIFRKLGFFIIMQLIYYNLCYYFIIPKIYSDSFYFISLVIYYVISLIDTILRPLDPEDKIKTKYDIIILFLFLLGPWFLIMTYFENKMIIADHFPFWDNLIISNIGISLFIIGGIITIAGRIQLGTFATGRLKIKEDHELIDFGMYKYVRNPIYSGSIIGIIGFELVFRSIFMTILLFILYFLLLRMRIIEEERLLKKQFKEKFEDYMKKTKRLFPFIY